MPTGRWDRGRREGLLHPPEHAGSAALQDRLKPSQLEPRQCDWSFPAKGPESEVGEEVGRKDRAVDDEALVAVSALRIAVAKRLDRLHAAITRFADRREEEALHHPRRLQIHQIGAGDQDCVGRRRSGRQLLRPRKMLGRGELHRAEEPLLTVVERPPCPPLLLDPICPPALLRSAPAAGLPEDAPDARRRRVGERDLRQWMEPVGHGKA